MCRAPSRLEEERGREANVNSASEIRSPRTDVYAGCEPTPRELLIKKPKAESLSPPFVLVTKKNNNPN